MITSAENWQHHERLINNGDMIEARKVSKISFYDTRTW
jgi:hypothetical protein